MFHESWSWYLRRLETDPFKTKALTSAFFKSLSETTAQTLKRQSKIEVSLSLSRATSMCVAYNESHTNAVESCMGICFVWYFRRHSVRTRRFERRNDANDDDNNNRFCQFWYSRLPRLTTLIAGPEKKTHALIRTGVSTVLDTLIFSPVFYVLYFLFFGFASGTYKNLREAIEDIKVKLFPAWSAGTKVWPAANFFTMFFLPQKLWMPANNLVAYAFNIYLSLLNSDTKTKKKKHCD